MSTETRFENADLIIVLSDSNNEATMNWLGSSDSRDPIDFLQPVFQRVMLRLKGRRLTIDFTQLEFMSSSTVSPIISLLKTLDGKRIQTRVVFGQEDWQQVHMRCIRTITRVLSNVTVEGSDPNSTKG